MSKPAETDRTSHPVMDAARSQSLLSQEAVALTADEISGRHPNAQIDILAWSEPPVRGVRILHVRDIAHDVDLGCVGRHDHHRGSLVRMDVGVGHHHHDQEVGDRPVD